MRIFHQIFKPKIIYFGLFLLFITNNCFSQNLSFDELIKLQKETKNNVSKFLKEKKWQINTALDYLWEYNDSSSSSVYNSLFVYRDFNCNNAILYYKFNDSMLFNELKNDAGKLSLSNKKINYPDNSIIYDFYFKDLFVRFYINKEINDLPYSCWIFSNKDGWYFGELNKFCLKKLEIDTVSKPIRLDWFYAFEDDKETLFAKQSDTSRKISLPEFPGGDVARIKFMENNIKIPLKARHNKNPYGGSWYFSFIVEKDGTVTSNNNYFIDEWGYHEEIEKALKIMPRWRPATENNKPIRVELIMGIFFMINEYSKFSGIDMHAPVITR
ncbi:MAG: hypothetical protein NTZ33_07990 [Bacteroidetes bacterium]|nr:hypothetical protein [Bacteroidota bacterium]